MVIHEPSQVSASSALAFVVKRHLSLKGGGNSSLRSAGILASSSVWFKLLGCFHAVGPPGCVFIGQNNRNIVLDCGNSVDSVLSEMGKGGRICRISWICRICILGVRTSGPVCILSSKGRNRSVPPSFASRVGPAVWWRSFHGGNGPLKTLFPSDSLTLRCPTARRSLRTTACTSPRCPSDKSPVLWSPATPELFLWDATAESTET